MATEAEPQVSLVVEDPVRAIRNSVERIRELKRRAVESQDASAILTMDTSVEEELEVVERALQRLEPT